MTKYVNPAMLTQRIKITNDRSSFITSWLEPWGEDYGMSSGDEVETVAADAEADFYLHISPAEEGMKVYAEGGAQHVSVYQAGEVLTCGHKWREERW